MRVAPITIAATLLQATFVAEAQFDTATNNGAITITGYYGPGGAVAIPTNLNGLPVTAIGNEAFYEHNGISSLDIPDTVTNIGEYAFFDCMSLFSVTMPAGLVSIGDYAFEYCSLTNVALPTNLISIGSGAFSFCSNLADFTLSTSLTNIGIEAFLDCAHLTNIVIPGQVTSIGEYAFAGCSRLHSISIPPSVTNIGYGSFQECTGLTNITLPGNLCDIGQYAFYNCSNLASVYFNGNVPGGDNTVFASDNATAYYMPGASGWGSSFGGIPTALQTLPYPVILATSPSFGMANSQFGFTIAWATNVPVIVQACSNLSNPVWAPVATNSLTNGLCFFTDPNSTNLSMCLYRVTSAVP